MSWTCRLAIALIGITLLPSLASAQSWDAPADGGASTFETANDWTGDAVPGNNGDVEFDGTIDQQGDTSCTIGTSRTIDTLTITNAWSATLTIPVGVTLTLDSTPGFAMSTGTVALAGTIDMTASDFAITGGTFTNTGTLRFTDNANQTISDSTGTQNLGNVEMILTGGTDNLFVGTNLRITNLSLIDGDLDFSANNRTITITGSLSIAEVGQDADVIEGAGVEFEFSGVCTWSSNDAGENFGDLTVKAGSIVTLGSNVTADVVTVEPGGILLLDGNTLTAATLNNNGIVVSGAGANVYRWGGAAGDWDTAANWIDAQTNAVASAFPAAGDVAIFDSTTGDCTLDANAAAAALLMRTTNTDDIIFASNFTLTLGGKAQLFGGDVVLGGTTGLLTCAALDLNGGALTLGDGQPAGGETNVALRLTGTDTALVVTSGTLTVDGDAAGGVGGILLDGAGVNSLNDPVGAPTYNLGRVVHASSGDVSLVTPITVHSYTGTSSVDGQLDHNGNTLTITGDAAGAGLVFNNTDHVINTDAAAAAPAYAFTGATGDMSWSAAGTGGDQQFHTVQISGTNTLTVGSNLLIDSTVTVTGGSPTLAGTGTFSGGSDDSIIVSAGTLTITGAITVLADMDFTVQNAAALIVDAGSLTLSFNDSDLLTVSNTASVTLTNGGDLSAGDDIVWTSTGALTIGAGSRLLFGDDWVNFDGTVSNLGTIETQPSTSANGAYEIRTANPGTTNFGRVINAAGAASGDDLLLATNVIFTSYEQNSAEGLSFNGFKLTISGGGTSAGFVVNAGGLGFGGAATDLEFTGTSVWDDNVGNTYDDVSVTGTGVVSLRLRLPHGGVTGTLVAGDVVTGQTSGASATVSEVGANYLEVIAVVGGPTGLFQNGEVVQKDAPNFVTLSGAGAGTLTTNDLSVAGTLNLNGTTLDLAANTLTVTGALNTQDGGELEISSGATFTTTGATINAAGATVGGLIDLDAAFASTNTGAITLGAGDLTAAANLNLTGVSLSSAAGSTVTLEASLTLTAQANDDFTNVTVSAGTTTFNGTLDVAGTLDVDGTLDATGDTINAAGLTDIAGTLTVTNGTLNASALVDINGTLTTTGGTVNASDDIDETGGTWTDSSTTTLNFIGSAQQTLTLNSGLTSGAVSVNNAAGVVVGGSGTWTAGPVTLTAGILDANASTSFDGGGSGVGLTVQTAGHFRSTTVDGLIHSFAGNTQSVVLNGAGQFTVVDPADDATFPQVRVENGTTFTMNGTSTLTLTGQPTANLDFESPSTSNPFTMSVATGATVTVTRVDVIDSNAASSPQTPLVASTGSTLTRTDAGWVVGVLWLGGTDQSWDTGANWAGLVAPGPADVAIFTAASRTNLPPVTLGTTTQLAGIFVQSGFDGGSAGTLPIVVDADLLVTGNVTYSPPAAGPASKLNVGNAAVLTVRGNLSVDRTLGDGNGTLLFDVGGSSTLTPGSNAANVNLAVQVGDADSATTLTLSGTNALTILSLLVQDTTVAVGGVGAFSTGAGPVATLNVGGVTVENDATFAGGATTINFSGATWSSAGGATQSGAFNFTGGVQSFTTATGDAFGAMNVQGVVAADVTFNSAVTATSLNVDGGDELTTASAITLAGPLANAGTLTSSADITLAGNLTNSGTLSHTGGAIIFTANGVLTSGGDTLNALTIQNGAVVTTGDALTVTNAVTVQGNDASRLNMDPGNDALSAGSLVITRGVITLDAAGATIGTGGITFGAAGVRSLTMAGTVSLAGSFISPGNATAFTAPSVLEVTGATRTFPTASPVNTFTTVNVNMTAGNVLTLSGSSTVTATTLNVNTGVLDLAVNTGDATTDTSFGTTTVATGATLRNDDVDAVTHVFGAGGLSIADGGAFTVGTGLATGAESVVLSFANASTVVVGTTGAATFSVQGAGPSFHSLIATTGSWSMNAFATTNVTLSRVTIRDGDATPGADPIPVANGFNATPATNFGWDFGTKTTTWTGAGSDANWSTIANWDNGPPNDSATGDTVRFGADNGASSQDLSFAGDGLTLASLDMSFGPFTGTLDIDNRITVVGAATLDGTVDLQATTWSSASLTINGVLQGAGASTVSTGAFTMNAGADYNEGTGSTTVTGNVTIDPTATWVNGTGTLVFAAPSPSAGNPGLQSWSGSGDGASGLGEVRIDNADTGAGEGVRVTLAASALVASLVIDDNDELQIAASQTLSTTAAGSVTVGDATTGNGIALLTVLGAGAGDALSVHDLTLNANSDYTETTQATVVSGDLTIHATATWIDAAGVLTFAANVDQSWTGSGDAAASGVGAVSVTGTNGRVEVLSDVRLTTLDVGATKTVDGNANTVVILGDGTDTTPLSIALTGAYVSTGLTEFASTIGVTIPTTLASYDDLTLSGAGVDTLEGNETITGRLTVDTGTLNAGAVTFQADGITGTGAFNALGAAITTTGGLDVASFTPGTALTFAAGGSGGGNWGGTSSTGTFGVVTISGGAVVATADLVVASLTTSGGSLAMGTNDFTSSGAIDLVGVAFTQGATGTTTLGSGALQAFATDGDTVGILTLTAGTDLTLAGALITLGAVNLGTNSDLSVPASTGIDIGGSITIPSGSVLDVDEDSLFRGGVTVNGTFTANTGNIVLSFGNGTTLLVNTGGALTVDDVGSTQLTIQGVASGGAQWNFSYQPGTVTHGGVTNGPFQVGERLTGGTSGAQAIVSAVGGGSLSVGLARGTFQPGETITGQTSTATATVSAFTPANVTVADVFVRDSSSSPGSIPSGTSNINLGNNTGWFDLNDLDAIWLGTSDNDWDDPSNWQGGALPTNGSNIVISTTAPIGPQDNFNLLPGPVTNLGGLVIADAWTPGNAPDETVRFNANVAIGGSVSIGAGSTVDVNATTFSGGSITGSGTLDVTDATNVAVGSQLSVTTYVKPTSGTLTISGTWSGASNFGNVVLGGAVTPGSPLVMDGLNVNGQTFVLGASNDLDVGASGVSDPAGTGTLNATGATINTAGGFTVGTYVPGTLLEFDGAGTWAGGANPNFGAVEVSAGTVTLGTAVTAGTLTLTGGTLDTSAANSYGLSATNLVVSGGGLTGNSSTIQPLSTLNTTGAGTVTLGAAGVLLFNDVTATVTCDAGDSLGVLRLTGSNASVSLSGTVSAGSVDLQGGTLGAGTSLLQVNTTWSVAAGATFSPGTGEVEFVTAAAHSLTIVGASPFYDLTVSAGTMTPASITTVQNDITCAGTWSENGTLNVEGDWDFTGGAFTRNNGAVVFNGGATQNITHGTGSFWVLRIQNGTTLVQQSTVPVFAQLQVQSGVLNQNSNSMVLDGVDVTATPISVTSGTGSINGNGGTMVFNVANDNLGAAVTLANPGTPGYHNVTLDSAGAQPHTYTSSGAFRCTGALSIDSAPVLNTFQMGSDVTVGSLTGTGVFNMGSLSFTLELTASGSPLVLEPANAANGTIRYNSTGAAAAVNTGFTYSNLELAGSGKSYTWAGTLSVSTSLTLTGGANFSTTPSPQNLTFTGGTNGSFRGNASTFTVGTLTVAKTAGTFLTLLGSGGGTRTITNLTHTSGVFNVDCSVRIVSAAIGVAGGVGTDADFRFDAANTTLTLGSSAAGTWQFDVYDRVVVGGQSSDVTLVLSADGTGATTTQLRILDDLASVALRGNPVGAGTSPNLTIKASTTNIPGFEPEILESGTTSARTLDVQNVDVQDNDCTGIVNGNTNGLGTYSGPGIQATASSQLNGNTPGWIFVGGGSISGQIAEAVSNSAGAIDTIRIYFNGASSLNQATLSSVHLRFTLIQSDAFGNEVTRIQGTAASSPLDSQVLEVEFGNGVGQTHVQGLSVVYDAPTSGFLRNSVGTPASIDFTLTPGGSPALIDGAAPVLLSSSFQDTDGNSGLDRATFFFSEPMTLSAGAGWTMSGFQPVTDTSDLGANVNLQLVIAGETLSPIALDFNGNQLTGADIAAEIQRQVRAVMAESPPGTSIVSGGGHSPLNRPAFMNFTCSYLEDEERYLLKAGVPLRWDASASEYVQDYSLSAVDVVVGGAGDASPFLKLGALNGGTRAPGAGTARAGVSVSGNIAVPGGMASTTATLSINGEPARSYDLSASATTLAVVAQELEARVRDAATNGSALGANATAYTEFVVVPDTTGVSGLANRLLFVVGGQGAATQVVVDSTTAFASAAQMGVGVAEQTGVTTLADAGGSLSGTYFTLDTPSTAYYVWLDVDNGSTDPAVVSRTGVEVDIRLNDDASDVADALAAALDALADLEAEVSGTSDQVLISATTPGNVPDAADASTGFGITVTNGFVFAAAAEAAGRDNTTTTVEDMLITSALGKNLLLGVVASDLVVSGSAVTIDLSNQANSGTGTPRYVVGDRNRNGGYLADASGWTNLAAAFGNVNAADGVVVQGDTDGDGRVEVDPGTNIQIDGSNLVLPGGTVGVSVTHQWTLVSAPGNVETTVVGTLPDFAGSLSGTFFLLSSTTTDYYVWFDVGGGGVDPSTTDSSLSTRTGVQVAIATNAPAADVATALAAALDALGDLEAEVDTININEVVVRSAVSGDSTDAADGGSAPTGFTFTVTDGSGGIDITSDTSSILDFGASLAGTYAWRLTLTVLDDVGAPVVVPGYTDGNGQVTATIFVDVQEIAPVADAGGDRAVIGTSVTLDGSGSFDPNGGVSSFTYAWSAVDQNGNQVAAGSFTGGSGVTPQTSSDPTFSPGLSGVYTVTLTVTKSSNPALTNSQSVQVIVNDPSDLLPVADAGDPQVGRAGAPVTLRGRASADPEGTPLTYQWSSLTAPEAVTISDPAGVEPTFVPSLPGSYTFELTVTDAGGLRSPPSTVTVQVIDDLGTDARRPPGAAGRAANLEQAVFLSAAPTNPGAASFILRDGRAVPTTVVDIASDPADDPAASSIAGLSRVDLIVAGTLHSRVYARLDARDFGLVSLRFQSGSSAVVQRFGRVGSSFVLDATRSQDDGAVTGFTWTQVGGPHRFATRNGNLISVVPQAAGTYEFELVVTDNIGLTSLPITVSVPVLPVTATLAGPPTAVATGGSGTTLVGGVLTSTGGSITLDGSESLRLATGAFTTGSLTYSWEQVAGATAVISDPLVATPTVNLPTEGPYAFKLTVADPSLDGVSASTVVRVSVNSTLSDAPVAIAGPVATQSLPDGGSVTVRLDAGDSRGAQPLTYLWGQDRGVPYAPDASGTGATLRIDQPGTYTVLLRVVGADGVVSPPTEVTFVVNSGLEPALASGALTKESSGGCAMVRPTSSAGPRAGLLLAALCAALWVVRRREGRA